MVDEKKTPLDKFLLTKEQTYWFNRGWKQAHKKFGLPETSREIYWKKQREILELKMLDIINLAKKGSNYYRKGLRIASSYKYFDLVFGKDNELS